MTSRSKDDPVWEVIARIQADVAEIRRRLDAIERKVCLLQRFNVERIIYILAMMAIALSNPKVAALVVKVLSGGGG